MRAPAMSWTLLVTLSLDIRTICVNTLIFWFNVGRPFTRLDFFFLPHHLTHSLRRSSSSSRALNLAPLAHVLSKRIVSRKITQEVMPLS